MRHVGVYSVGYYLYSRLSIIAMAVEPWGKHQCKVGLLVANKLRGSLYGGSVVGVSEIL